MVLNRQARGARSHANCLETRDGGATGPRQRGGWAMIAPGDGTHVADLDGTALDIFTWHPGGTPRLLLVVFHGMHSDADVYRVHAHFGDPCPRCGETLRRVDFEEHTITYCPDCQTGGRVLKDRRLSRILR